MRSGLIRIRNHCTFHWHQEEGQGRQSVEITSKHCAECVAELRELGYRLVHEGRRG